MTVSIVAIDGPAGSGKSTVARELAQRLGAESLDTGAIYRALTLICLRQGVQPTDDSGVAALLPGLAVDVRPVVRIAGVDLQQADLRSAEVNELVPTIAQVPDVRAFVRRVQRDWAETSILAVVEGRDVGTVVFPDASVKVFLTAVLDERVRRRLEQASGSDRQTLAAQLNRRDGVDRERDQSPLRPAADAVVIDTTDLDIAAVVDRIQSLVQASSLGGSAHKE